MSALAAVGNSLGLWWDGRAWAGAVAGAQVRVEPHGRGAEIVSSAPGLPRDLWISASSMAHQGTVLRTHDPDFDRSILVVTDRTDALAWFDAATRARIRRCLRGRDRCSGLRVRLHRDAVDRDLAAQITDAATLTAHLGAPPPPLHALLGDPVPTVRLAAAVAVGDAPTLESLLDHRAAAAARAHLPTPPPSLEDTLRGHLRARATADVVRALGAVGTAACLPELRRCRLPGDVVRDAVAAIRARVGGAPGALSVAAEGGGLALDDPSNPGRGAVSGGS